MLTPIISCCTYFSNDISIGKYDEALVYYQEDLDVRRSVLGNTHPDTLVSISHIGSTLYGQGDVNNISL